MSYLITIGIIGFIILAHEFGHFIFAKMSGLPVKRFSIGFGPKLLSFKKGETEYCLALFPVGGYVLPAIKDEKEFFTIPLKKRLLFTIGGPVFNIILALILFAVINIMNSGFSLSKIFITPFVQVTQMLAQFFAAFIMLFSHPEQISGIIGIVASGGAYIQSDLLKTLQFSLLLNINLAVLNLLPLPPLDGGKIVMYLLEKMDRRMVKLHIPFAVTGWVLLLALVLYSTFADITNLI